MTALTPERLDLQNRLINSSLLGRLIGASSQVSQTIITTEKSGDVANALVVYTNTDDNGVQYQVSRRIRYRRKPLTELLAVLTDPINWSYDYAISLEMNQTRLNGAIALAFPEFSGCKLEITQEPAWGQVLVSGANCPVFFGNGQIPYAAVVPNGLMRWNFGSSTYDPQANEITVITTPQNIYVGGAYFPVHRAVFSGDLLTNESLHLTIPQEQIDQYAQVMCFVQVKAKSQPAYIEYASLASSMASETKAGIGDRFDGSGLLAEFGSTGRQGELVFVPQGGQYMNVYGRGKIAGINRWNLWKYVSMVTGQPEGTEYDFEVEVIGIGSPVSTLKISAQIKPSDSVDVDNIFNPTLTNATYEYGSLHYNGEGLIDSDGDDIPDVRGAQLQWPISDDRRCRIVMPETMPVGQSISVTLSDGAVNPMTPGLPTIKITSTSEGYVMQDTAGLSASQPVAIEAILLISADSSYQALSCTNGVGTVLLPGNGYPSDPRITVTVIAGPTEEVPSIQVSFVTF